MRDAVVLFSMEFFLKKYFLVYQRLSHTDYPSFLLIYGMIYKDSEKDKAAHKDAVDTTNFSEI